MLFKKKKKYLFVEFVAFDKESLTLKVNDNECKLIYGYYGHTLLTLYPMPYYAVHALETAYNSVIELYGREVITLEQAQAQCEALQISIELFE